MSATPTRSIATALGTAAGPISTVAQRVRRTLTQDGWRVVKAKKLEELTELLDTLYVDNRRQRQVDTLEKARKLAQSL